MEVEEELEEPMGVAALGHESSRKHYGRLEQLLTRPALLMLEEAAVGESNVMGVVEERRLRVVGEEQLAGEGSR